ncbi:MAG: hypothetical protein ACI9D5_002365 [Candidatus Endobugula sp.]|jgi:uncharacterized protein YjfI (DUF2170 family)
MTNLSILATELNTCETKTGATFVAEVLPDNETIQVTSSIDPDAVVFLVATEEQLLTITPLFKLGDVDESLRAAFYEDLLRVSPVIPLSSVGLQGDDVILFGSMSVNTVFDNIAHEIECQADNYSEVLAALSEYF